VPEECDFGDCDGDFLSGDGGASTEKMVEDAVDIIEVLPDKAADLRVSGNGLVPTIFHLVASRWSFDAYVI